MSPSTSWRMASRTLLAPSGLRMSCASVTFSMCGIRAREPISAL